MVLVYLNWRFHKQCKERVCYALVDQWPPWALQSEISHCFSSNVCSVTAFYDLCTAAPTPELERVILAQTNQLFMSSASSRALVLVTLGSRSCARSSVLRCLGQISWVFGKWLVIVGVWTFVQWARLRGNHGMLWRALEYLGGAGDHVRERSWGKNIIWA